MGKKPCRIVIKNTRPETEPNNLLDDTPESISESLILIKSHIASQAASDYNKFILDKSVIDFNSLEEEEIKIFIRNVTQVGCCYETYLVEIQEFSKQLEDYCCIGTQVC